MTPSRMTGVRAAAAPSRRPTTAACSRPPTAASASSGRSATGAFTRRAVRMTSILRSSVASSIPVPRPVTSATSLPVNTLVRAADAVVFAMPMSPVTSSRLPCATSELATSIPTSTAASTSSAVMAGPWLRSAVPRATLRDNRPGAAGTSPATPTSTTVTSAPTCRPSALMTAPPARKLPTICVVTSCGQGDTPWAWTPWSPANTAIATGAGSGGGHSAYMPARREPRSSSAPSEPRGLVSMACRASAAATACSDAGSIRVTVSLSRLNVPPRRQRVLAPSWTVDGTPVRGGSPCESSRPAPAVVSHIPCVGDHFDTLDERVGPFTDRKPAVRESRSNSGADPQP